MGSEPVDSWFASFSEGLNSYAPNPDALLAEEAVEVKLAAEVGLESGGGISFQNSHRYI